MPRNLYLLAAVVGALVPYAAFASFFLANGWAFGAFLATLFANGAVAGFTADLLISSLVFWLRLFSRSGGPNPWPFVVVNLTVGLSCALPLYLYFASGRAQP